MKSSWISVETEMPPLHFISPNWQTSHFLLLYAKAEDQIYLGRYQEYYGKFSWVGDYTIENISHWQRVEAP